MPTDDTTKPAHELEPGDIIVLRDGEYRVLDRSMPNGAKGNDTLMVHLRTVDGRFNRTAAFPPELKITIKAVLSTANYSPTRPRPKVRKLNRSELQVLKAISEAPLDERSPMAIADRLGWSPWLIGRIMRRLETLGMLRTGMN